MNVKFKLKKLPGGTVDRNTVPAISVVRNCPITGVHQPLNIASMQNSVASSQARDTTAPEAGASSQHMPCIAYLIQRRITVCPAESGFCDTLAKCRKIVGHCTTEVLLKKYIFFFV